MVFFTQITMEAAEDPEFLDAMQRAHIQGALVGVESVTAEGLKDVYKDFNLRGRRAGRRGCRPSASTACTCSARSSSGCRATARRPSTPPRRWRRSADVTFAQFVMLTPFPGTVDFERGRRRSSADDDAIDGIPITRHWLIPQDARPKIYIAASDDVGRRDPRAHAGRVGRVLQPADRSGSARACVKSLKARLAFVLISKLYRQMYANTGIATDSARVTRSARWARLIARCRGGCSSRSRCRS